MVFACGTRTCVARGRVARGPATPAEQPQPPSLRIAPPKGPEESGVRFQVSSCPVIVLTSVFYRGAEGIISTIESSSPLWQEASWHGRGASASQPVAKRPRAWIKVKHVKFCQFYFGISPDYFGTLLSYFLAVFAQENGHDHKKLTQTTPKNIYPNDSEA